MKKLIILLILIILLGCTPKNSTDTPGNLDSEVTFLLHHEEGKNIKLLRRGTLGVASAANEYEMDWIDDHYEVSIDVLEGTMFEYAYAIDTSDAYLYEENIIGQMMYRTVHIENEGVYEDWYTKSGTLSTEVYLSSNGISLQGLIVESEGQRTSTMADGVAELDNITAGTSLTVYDTYGRYHPMTVKVEDSISLELTPTTMTTVSFQVTNKTGIDNLRVAGLSGQFGYKYFQENSRYFDEDGRQLLYLNGTDDLYSGTVELPVGTVLSYSYTIGTGSFGVEKDEYRPIIRDVLITENMVIEDRVVSFDRPNEVLVTFDPNVEDEITLKLEWQTIRFTDSISLFLPKDSSIEYRYMSGTEGFTSENLGSKAIDYYYGYNEFRTLNTTNSPVTLHDEIEGWLDFRPLEFETNIGETRNIFTGIMMADYWNSAYYDSFEDMIPILRDLNPTYLLNSPVWNFNSIIDEPKLESFGQSLYSVAIPDDDLTHWAELASEFKLGMYQQVNPEMLEGGVDEFFNSGAKSDEWWELYYKELNDFYLYYAVLAEKNGFELLRLPDSFVGETLGYFENEGQKAQFDIEMNNLIDEVKTVYTGSIYTSVEIFNNSDFHFTYLERMDYLSNKFWFDVNDIDNSLIMFKDQLSRYKLESDSYGVPFFVDQLAFFTENLTIEDDYEFLIAQYYNEVFKVINETEWIEGVILFGYPYHEGGSVMNVADNVIRDWFTAFNE